MELQVTGNVTQLSDYRPAAASPPTTFTDRQIAVREHLLNAAGRSPEEAPVALVGMSVMPSGKINSVAFQIEPEHVIPVLAAMRQLMDKLESYLTSSLASRHLMLCALVAGIEFADIALVPAMAAIALIR